MSKIRQASPVVALVGDFGDGKSSVLNLLARKLRKQQGQYITVTFNSWLPGSQEALVSSFVKSLLDALKEQFDLERVEERVHNYARTLAGLIPRAGTGLLNLFKERSQAEEINNLISLTRNLRLRIVVLVDDLDRMHKAELESLFKLVRGVPEFQQITYVCAFSKEALVRQLSVESDDRSYYYRFIEKFFPVQVELSKIDSNVLSLEFDKRFEALCKRFTLLVSEESQSQFNTEFYPIWARYGRRFLTNLRRLNLYFESLDSLLASARNDINLYDAMLLELLKEAHPEIIEIIYRHSYYFYQGEWRWETAFEIPPNRDSQKSERSIFMNWLIEGIPASDREITTGLLKELFPSVYEHLTGHRPIGIPSKAQAEKLRKIYHPVSFPCYFIHRTPLDKFGATEFDQFRSLVNSETDEIAIQSRFYSTFGGLSFEPKRLDFLNWLFSSVEELGAIQTNAMAKAVSRIFFRFNPTEIVGEFKSARNFVLAAVRKLGQREGNKLLKEVIGSAAADAFAADILIHATNDDRNRLKPSWIFDEQDLRRTFSTRIRRRYLEEGESIFVLERNSGLHVLYRWKQCGDEAAKDEEKYLDKEFETAPSNLTKFLVWTWSDFPNQAGEFERAVQLYSIDKIKDLLAANPNIVGETPEESKTLERFREAHVVVKQAPKGTVSTPDEVLFPKPMDWGPVDLRVELNQAFGSNMMIVLRNLSDEELKIRRITLRSNRIDLGNPASPNSDKPWVLSARGIVQLTLNIGSSLKNSLITANGGSYGITQSFNLDFSFLCEAKGSTRELLKTIRIQTDQHNDAVLHVH